MIVWIIKCFFLWHMKVGSVQEKYITRVSYFWIFAVLSLPYKPVFRYMIITNYLKLLRSSVTEWTQPDFLQNRESNSSKLIVSRNTIFIQNTMEVYILKELTEQFYCNRKRKQRVFYMYISHVFMYKKVV